MPQLLPSVGRWSILVGVAAVLAACSESTTTPPRDLTPSASNANQYPEFNGPSADAHIMHTKPWHEANDNASGNAHGRGGGGSGGGNGISYHGGPVLIAGTNVVAVYWSPATIFNKGPTPGTKGAGSSDQSLVGFFLGNLGGSSYFAINTTYTDGLGTPIPNTVNYTAYWANGSAPPLGKVSDAQIVAMLQSGFDSGNLAYNASTLYAVFTAGTTNLGGGFGTQYCAYHTHGTVTIGGIAKNVLYAAMPYNYAFPGSCTNGSASPNGDPGADAEVNTLAHEIEETTTDEMGSAWFDTFGYENADKCAWKWGTTYTSNGGLANINVGGKDFLVQMNWVNANGGSCKQSWP